MLNQNMPQPVIKIENLCKIYRLGEIGTGTISRDLERWYKMKIKGQEDPFLRIGETNERNKKGLGDVVYSLKGINLDIQPGEALGIIGKNGAGKSTLLKIISRVTGPTTGVIKIKGRVASLLEVGTGFHPELTGKENIYLNGAILGMSKKEITRKLDEIIDFSGVERYIDTPVKRYSSGMYVRLAFAVAAHLESEILIVDEVLAVGDAEFQKKCLGKMSDVTRGEGRTVLFVSHNMGAIQNLCSKAILLNQGTLLHEGSITEVIEEYLMLSSKKSIQSFSNRYGNKKAEILEYNLFDSNGKRVNDFLMGDNIFVQLRIKFHDKITRADIGINIKNNMGELISHISSFDDSFSVNGEKGDEKIIKIKLCNIYYSPTSYILDIAILNGSDHFDMIEDCISFNLAEGEKIKRGYFPKYVKVFTPSNWSYDN
jgi:lipopolysaccharide transport system ATP-binding protein